MDACGVLPTCQAVRRLLCGVGIPHTKLGLMAVDGDALDAQLVRMEACNHCLFIHYDHYHARDALNTAQRSSGRSPIV